MRARKAGVVTAFALLLTGIVAAIVWAGRALVLATVEGTSMEPTLRAGDRVLVRRRRLAAVRQGDVVVLQPPPERGVRLGPLSRWHIKRVVALPGDPVPSSVARIEGVARVPRDALVVYGDSPTSADSRHRGFYSGSQLLGVVVRALPARRRS